MPSGVPVVNVSVHLFDHVVDAVVEVLAPFVVARELLHSDLSSTYRGVGCSCGKAQFLEDCPMSLVASTAT